MILEERVELGDGARVTVIRGWLSEAAAAQAVQRLREELQWEHRAITLFGRKVLQPRLIAWAGTRPYRYSHLTLPPRPAPPSLDALNGAVVRQVGVKFNHVLLNRYRNGADHMGWHADDEPELGRKPIVASLSLGQRRDFCFKRRGNSKASRATISLGTGDLLVMGNTVQRLFVHCLPKRKHADQERISLTYRDVLADPV